MDETATSSPVGVVASTVNGLVDHRSSPANGFPDETDPVNPVVAANGLAEHRPCPDRGSSSKFLDFFRNISLEPVILLNGLAMGMQAVIVQELTKEQSCLASYNHTEVLCGNVTDAAISAALKRTVSNYNLFRLVLETAPCVFLAMFLGAWSDKHGPKLLVLVPLAGDALSSALYGLLAHARRQGRPLQLLLLPSALQGITGGNLAFNLGVCCYIIARSSLDARTTRIAFTDVAFGIGIPVGRILGGYLFTRYGYELVFTAAFLLNCSAFVWALVRLSRVPHLKNSSKMRAVKDLFRLQNLKNCVRVLVKKREGGTRLHMGLILGSAILVAFPRKGETNIAFLFTQAKFRFTVSEFSTYDAFSMASSFVGTLIVLPILSYFIHINDIIIAIVAMFASMTNDILIAFSTSPLMLYIAAQMLLLSASASVICRSMLTKCVNQDELGKLLALIGLFGSAVPLISGIFYTQIFNATLTTFPGTCYLMSASITIIPALCFIWLYIRLRKIVEDPPEQQEHDQNNSA